MGATLTQMSFKSFQSYQFRQINPDPDVVRLGVQYKEKFQSYQFRQINPDMGNIFRGWIVYLSFNRINSGRSIPTMVKVKTCSVGYSVSIVSIQADQSRHLRLRNSVRLSTSFQSYQFRQINPDYVNVNLCKDNKLKFQSYQFRQINPDWWRRRD